MRCCGRIIAAMFLIDSLYLGLCKITGHEPSDDTMMAITFSLCAFSALVAFMIVRDDE